MRYLFVLGAPRSGTTLLQNLLATQPGARSAPETGIFARLTKAFLYERGLPPVGRRPTPATLSRQQADQARAHLARKVALPAIDWNQDLGKEPWTTRQVLERLFRELAGPGAEVFIEKTPTHAYFIREIRELFPDAILLHVVRDPRDVAASLQDMLTTMGKQPRSAFERARIWQASEGAATRAGIRTVRYEDLVKDPGQVLHTVCAEFGLPFEPDLLGRSTEVAQRTVTKRETWKANNFGAVTVRSVGRYRAALTANDIAVIESVCRAGMQRRGYTLDHPRTAGFVLLRQASGYYAGRARRWFQAAGRTIREPARL